MGDIITFYSYKGGVGRSMALANIAVVLAQWKYNVLIIDWDLEAPGLEFFFKNHFSDWKKVREKEGVIDILSDAYKNKGTGLDLKDLLIDIKISEDCPPIKFLTAGKRDDDYFNRVRKLDFQSFYNDKNGGQSIEELRHTIKTKFDFILIDSRTGITDIGGICTVQLPDILVLLFTATEQSLNGIVDVARNANLSRKKFAVNRYRLLSIPIPSRFDANVEFEISEEWSNIFSEKLKEIYMDWLPKGTDRLNFLDITKIPYMPYFSYGEKLSVLEQRTGDPKGLGYTYVTLAALLADRLENVQKLIDNRSEFIANVSRNKQIIYQKAEDSIAIEKNYGENQILLFYGASGNLEKHKNDVIQFSKAKDRTVVLLDLSNCSDTRQTADAFLRTIVEQIGDGKENISNILKQAKEDADKRYGAFDYAETMSPHIFDPWSQHYMSHAEDPFFRWLKNCCKDRSTPIVFLFDHFESISNSLQWVMEYYLFRGFKSLENVECLIFHKKNQQPSWKTFFAKDYVVITEYPGPKEIKARKDPNLAGFKNPYVVGRPVKQSNMVYGRKDIIDSIVRDLFDGRNAIAISAEHKSGKSSLLFNLNKLIPNDFTEKFNSYIPVYLNLQDIDKPVEKHRRIERLMWHLAYEIHKTIQREVLSGIPAPLEKEFSEMPIKFFNDDFLREKIFNQLNKEKKLLLLIDEFDVITTWIDKGDNEPEFFRFLGQQFQRPNRLAFIFAGTDELRKLVGRYPEFFNPIRFLEMGLLSEKNTRELIVAPVEGVFEYETAAVDTLFEMSGGHPYITQVICHTMVNHARRYANALITSGDVEEIIENVLDEAHYVFKMIWNSCNKPQQNILIDMCSSENHVQISVRDLKTDGDTKKLLDSLAKKNILRSEKNGFVSRLFYLWLRDRHLATECLSNNTAMNSGNYDIHSIINNVENETLEYKVSLRWDHQKKEVNKTLEKVMLKTVAGFLNANGGKLVIGIDDNHNVMGLEKDYNTLRRQDRDGYQKFIMESISQNIGKAFCHYVRVSLHDLDGKDICLVAIEPSPNPAYVRDGKDDIFYLRTGNQTQQLNAREAIDYCSTRFKGVH